MADPDNAREARYLLECSTEHMLDVHKGDNALVLAARSQVHAILAVAEAIEKLTRVVRESCGQPQ